MKYRENLTSQRFGKLVVIEYAGKKKSGNANKTMWKCKCDCGNYTIVNACDLKSNHTTSCGCVFKEYITNLNKKHGYSQKERLYSVWKNIKQRCFNKNNKRYDSYGGRGITICEEWANNYLSFREWSYSNGYSDETLPSGRNKLTIDRIDNNGNYEPKNCRWVNDIVQAQNKRNSRKINNDI